MDRGPFIGNASGVAAGGAMRFRTASTPVYAYQFGWQPPANAPGRWRTIASS